MRHTDAPKALALAIAIAFAAVGLFGTLGVLSTVFDVPASAGTIRGRIALRSTSVTTPPRCYLLISEHKVEVSEDTYRSTREGEHVRLVLGQRGLWRVDR